MSSDSNPLTKEVEPQAPTYVYPTPVVAGARQSRPLPEETPPRWSGSGILIPNRVVLHR